MSVVVIGVTEARQLAHDVMTAVGVGEADADAVADHVVEAELRGHVGLARLTALVEHVARHGAGAGEPVVTPSSGPTALVDGAGRLGMVVGRIATDVAVARAAEHGVALVAATNHRYSGILAYYVEHLVRTGLVAVAAASGSPVVAPYGGTEPRLSTNPLALGFPVAEDDPVIHDFATSAISGGELLRLAITGGELPPDAALDQQGRPTVSPQAASEGTLLTWGGHKGFGLSVSIQAFCLLAGMAPLPGPDEGWSLLLLAIDPGRVRPDIDFPRRAAELVGLVRATAPLEPSQPVRVPFERSADERRRRLRDGIPVPEPLHAELRALSRRAPAAP